MHRSDFIRKLHGQGAGEGASWQLPLVAMTEMVTLVLLQGMALLIWQWWKRRES